MGRTILIAVVVAIVVAVIAGFVGYRTGDAAGFERANLVRQQFAASRQGAQGNTSGGFGATGGGGGNRAFELQGTVKSVDGNTMVVTVGQRDVTVTLTDQTQFLKSVSGTRTDLAAGARVMVTPAGGNGGGAGAGGSGGTTGGANAAVNAASVTVLPAQ
jgi:hypothetical protein